MSAQPAAGGRPRTTVATFAACKADGTPIVMSTAYDYATAQLVDAAGVDAILVGDSLGMTVLGFDSTLPVTLDDMVRHTAAVTRGTSHAMVIADMPFMSWQADSAEGMRNAARLIAEGGAHAVKLEGASFDTRVLIGSMTEAGIPVMGHIGLTPQSVNTLGGYRVQGKDAEAAVAIMDDAVALAEAGCFAIVLECVPTQLARAISEMVPVPTIGIGAGVGCDGQVQVLHDLVGLGTADWLPKHAKRYGDAGAVIRDAIAAYADDVRAGRFPTAAESTDMDPEQFAEAALMFGGITPEDDE